MKIRWTSDSVRYRITPRELAELRAGRSVSEDLRLPGGSWVATISRGAPLTLELADGALTLSLDEPAFSRFDSPEAEGVYLQIGVGDAEIRCSIEKDFPCVHPRGAEALEPVTETFEPPSDFEKRKLE